MRTGMIGLGVLAVLLAWPAVSVTPRTEAVGDVFRHALVPRTWDEGKAAVFAMPASLGKLGCNYLMVNANNDEVRLHWGPTQGGLVAPWVQFASVETGVGGDVSTVDELLQDPITIRDAEALGRVGDLLWMAEPWSNLTDSGPKRELHYSYTYGMSGSVWFVTVVATSPDERDAIVMALTKALRDIAAGTASPVPASVASPVPSAGDVCTLYQ